MTKLKRIKTNEQVHGYSDCCDAPIYNEIVYQGDGICSYCNERCNDIDIDPNEETPSEMNERLRSMGF
jgi:hypothetical protein